MLNPEGIQKYNCKKNEGKNEDKAGSVTPSHTVTLENSPTPQKDQQPATRVFRRSEGRYELKHKQQLQKKTLFPISLVKTLSGQNNSVVIDTQQSELLSYAAH